MINRRSVALAALSLSMIVANRASAKWSIMFIPDEATGVTISIDGEHVLDWKSIEGQTVKDIPAKWAELEKLHIRADGSPNDKSAHVKVYWNDKVECDMKFDKGEDCDANR